MATYALAHLALAAVTILAASFVARRRFALAVCVAFGGLLPFLALELARPWSHDSAHWGNPIHGAKLNLLFATVLGVAAALAHRKRGGRFLAPVLVSGVLGLALLTTSLPPSSAYPPAVVDADGIVRQTTRKSCAAAAAATLLRKLAIDVEATEEGLAQLCRTDAQTGTADGALVQGISLAAPKHTVRIVRADLPKLKKRSTPCVLFVGLDRGRAGSDALYRVLRDECGWPEGEAHTVVYLGVEPGRPGEDKEVAVVGDPRSGLERWGIAHFNALWDGRALEVRPH